MGKRMQEALLRALGKEEPKVEHVDIGKKLEELGLAEHLPSELWPPMGAVRELAQKLKSLKKAGFENSFFEVVLTK